MHDSEYDNVVEKWTEGKEEYITRLLFCKENGINTVILTGTGEPIQNKSFLRWFGKVNKERVGFRWIEIQTSGNLLLSKENDVYENLKLLKDIGVTTISLSLSNIFDSERNALITTIPKSQQFDIYELCTAIKGHRFNLRLSLNMSDEYAGRTVEEIFTRAKELHADQITFRKLYATENGNAEQDKWVVEHPCPEEFFEKDGLIESYVKDYGNFLGVLPFGASKYSVNGISAVIDDNCLDDAERRVDPETYKYLILRPNVKLYSDWSDSGSLIF